jgi:hypothetical protein
MGEVGRTTVSGLRESAKMVEFDHRAGLGVPPVLGLQNMVRRVSDSPIFCRWCHGFKSALPALAAVLAISWYGWGDALILGPVVDFHRVQISYDQKTNTILRTSESQRLRSCPGSWTFSIRDGNEYYLHEKNTSSLQVRDGVMFSERYQLPEYIHDSVYTLVVRLQSRCPFAAPQNQEWVSDNSVVIKR